LDHLCDHAVVRQPLEQCPDRVLGAHGALHVDAPGGIAEARLARLPAPTRDASRCAATLRHMMEYVDKAVRWGGTRFGRRIAKSIPFVGAVVVLASVGSTMRRKGAVGG